MNCCHIRHQEKPCSISTATNLVFQIPNPSIANVVAWRKIVRLFLYAIVLQIILTWGYQRICTSKHFEAYSTYSSFSAVFLGFMLWQLMSSYRRKIPFQPYLSSSSVTIMLFSHLLGLQTQPVAYSLFGSDVARCAHDSCVGISLGPHAALQCGKLDHGG